MQKILVLSLFLVLLGGCSDPRSQAYFEQSENKKERNFVLQECAENEGKRNSTQEEECKNAALARAAEKQK